MSEQNLSDNFFNSEESGIPVPPADQGWAAMQHMLDKAMPVNTPSTPSAPTPTPTPGVSALIKGLVKAALISGTAITVSISSWWLYKQFQQTKDSAPAVTQATVNIPLADSVQLQRDSGYAATQTSILSDSTQKTVVLPEAHPARTDSQYAASSGIEQGTVPNASDRQPVTATDAARRPAIAQKMYGNKSTPVAAAAVRSSNGHSPAGSRRDTKDPDVPSAHNKAITAQQSNASIKEQRAINGRHPSRPVPQTLAGTSNGSKETAAGLLSKQQSASTDPAIPSTGKEVPRAGSPQLPGAGKPPAASGVKNSHDATPFAGNDLRKKATKPKAERTTDDQQPADIPAKQDKLPFDINRTSGELSATTTENRWVLEAVKQPDQSRNVSLLHNNKDKHRMPTTAVTRPKREVHAAWNIYGQLSLAIPTEGSTYYFTGPDGTKQYWRLLIPSLRIERAIGHMALSIDVMPSLTTILPSNEHHSRGIASSFPEYDTIHSVLKQYGSGFTLQAHYFLTPHLKISAGAQLSLLGKATVAQTLADTSNTRGLTTLRAGTKTETDSLAHSRISGVFEVYYEFRKWQTGVRTIVPFTNTGLQKDWPIKTPVQVELLIRRRLFTR